MLDPRKIACRLPDNLSSLPMAGDLPLLDLPRMGCMMLPYFSPVAYPKLALLQLFQIYLIGYEVAGLLPKVILPGELI
jgi:hypothetical protein